MIIYYARIMLENKCENDCCLNNPPIIHIWIKTIIYASYYDYSFLYHPDILSKDKSTLDSMNKFISFHYYEFTSRYWMWWNCPNTIDWKSKTSSEKRLEKESRHFLFFLELFCIQVLQDFGIFDPILWANQFPAVSTYKI